MTADDFGQSSEINQAVALAHDQGILTCASLMVTGPAAAEAVQLARQRPRLGVGLHLTLVDGIAVSSPSSLAGIVDRHGRFSSHPIRAGWRYWWRRDLRDALRREIHAQFDSFASTGLPMDHVNGHLHFHLHPSLLSHWVDKAVATGAHGARLTRDSWAWNVRLARGRWCYRSSHALVIGALSRAARRAWRQSGLRHTEAVIGLLQSGRMNETFLLGLLPLLPKGAFEIYFHPSLRQGRQELEALVSERVHQAVARCGASLIRYADL